jgi:hypothetical protein
MATLRERADLFAAHTQNLLVVRPRWQFVDLATPADLLALCDLAVTHGPLLAQAGVAGTYALGWLADLAIYVDWIAAEVPDLARLLVDRDDAAAGRAVVELGLFHCDKPALAPILRDVSQRNPPWLDEPAELGRNPRELLDIALIYIQEERDTAPPPLVAA